MEKILIANRGEIARRIMRTCREMGISTVAVFSEPDRNALFVREADQAVALGGTAPNESYLRIDAVIEAAQRTGADAIHPGYGFLAENAEFAAACRDAGVKLIGPSPEAIAAMGSKIEAKKIVSDAGVPVLPSVVYTGQPLDALLDELADQPFPLLIKASAGGGGRGMRIVREKSELSAAIQAAQSEAAGAFGDDTLFVEPYVESPRHIEFQIFGDEHGNIVHLFERECSIQRRHQKIVEEAPSTALNDALRAEMGQAAVRAAEAIRYVNAGTVEFLLTPDRRFYFLEVNTRLQVEHPVTECITGLDLVRLQILVARGEPLPDDVRNATIGGHAIEVRLYAENPLQGFAPSTGTLHRFRIPGESGVRIEAGFTDGDEISPYYDSMLAKVIAHGPTREEAARRLARVLAAAQLHGPTTNRDLLVRLLRHPDFLSGETDTHFLERFPPEQLGRSLLDDAGLKLHAAAAALAQQARRRATTNVLRHVPSGWRNNPSRLQQTTFQVDDETIEVGYRLDREGLTLEIDGLSSENVRLLQCTPTEVELELDGISRLYEVHEVDDTVYVDSSLGSCVLKTVPRFPSPEDELAKGSLVAPLPGVINEVRVEVGHAVQAGDVLIVIESMKMLHEVAAPDAGVVTALHVEPASHVEAGAVLAVISDEEPET